MTRSALATLGALILLAGCASATSTAEAPESKDRAECKEYARTFEHSGRMKDACLISRGYTVSYSTNGGGVDVTARAQPRPAADVVATDLKACNDQAGMGYSGRLQFARCMTPRGYAVRSGD
ncbi:MAG: hypothetical protein ACHQ8D_01285 [Candidatus Rokuibacteriota bacterium]|jgi:hypothetical protein